MWLVTFTQWVHQLVAWEAGHSVAASSNHSRLDSTNLVHCRCSIYTYSLRGIRTALISVSWTRHTFWRVEGEKAVWTAECTMCTKFPVCPDGASHPLWITVSVPMAICINPPQQWFDAAWPLDCLHSPSSRLPSYKSPTLHGGFAIRELFRISHNRIAYLSEPDGFRRRRKGLGQTRAPITECWPGQPESLIANDVIGMVFPEIPSSQCCQRLGTADLSAVPCFTRVLEANNEQLCRSAMNVRVVSPPIANYSCTINSVGTTPMWPFTTFLPSLVPRPLWGNEEGMGTSGRTGA